MPSEMIKISVEKAVSLIENAGRKLKLPSNTIARAMIIYHHFKRCVGTVEYDDGLSAAAAISLSSQVDEKLVDQQTLVIVFWSILCGKDKVPKVNSEEFKELLSSITKVQYLFVRMLKFNLKYELAHQHLGSFLRALHRRKEFEENWDVFVNVLWKIVTTAYLTKKCLDHDASEIAVASVHIACTCCKINVEYLKDWQQGLALHISEDKLKHAICEILGVCNVSSINS